MIAEVSLVAVLLTVVINLSLASIAGVLSARLWLKLHVSSATSVSMWRILVASWTALAFALALLLLVQAAQLSEVSIFDAGSSAVLLVSKTYGGQAMAIAVVVSTIAAMVTFLRAHVFWISTLALSLVTVARASTGHAGQDGPVSLDVLVEWVHLMAMGLWVGSVLVAGWMTLPRLGWEPATVARTYVDQLSSWATGALVLIFLSGIFNTDRMLGNFSELLHTDYGRLLLAKIVVVIAALLLGALNRFRGLPAIHREPFKQGLVQFIFVLRAESVLLFAVTVLAGVLTNVSPHE